MAFERGKVGSIPQAAPQFSPLDGTSPQRGGDGMPRQCAADVSSHITGNCICHPNYPTMMNCPIHGMVDKAADAPKEAPAVLCGGSVEGTDGGPGSGPQGGSHKPDPSDPDQEHAKAHAEFMNEWSKNNPPDRPGRSQSNAAGT